MESRPSCSPSRDFNTGPHDAHQNANNGKPISTSLATKMRMIELRQAVILRFVQESARNIRELPLS